MNSGNGLMAVDFDPTVLRAFVAVSEAGSFTRAAQRLHLTQSAVSHQIRKLEDQIGRPLLLRTTRSLVLTEDGGDFLGHAKDILERLDALALRFRPSPISGVVRFGVPENFMSERLSPLLAQFARAFPEVRLDVNVSTYLDLQAMVKGKQLDLAVAMTIPGHETLGGDGAEAVIWRTEFVWAATDTFTIRRGASVPIAFAPAPCVNRQVGIRALEDTSIEWHIAYTSASQQGIRAAVLAGLAITVVTRGDIQPRMKVVDGSYGLPRLPRADFTLVWSAGEKTAAARAFGRMILTQSEIPPAPGAVELLDEPM